MMAEAACLVDGIFQYLLGIWSKINFVFVAAPFNADALDDFADTSGLEAKLAQDSSGNSALFLHQTKEQVLGSDAVLMPPFGFLMGQT
jgi:hypothetical protein